MKQLIDGVSIIHTNAPRGTQRNSLPFRYFPRSLVAVYDAGPGFIWLVFEWTRKDGHTILYFYPPHDEIGALAIQNSIYLEPPVPKLAGGYLFNYGVRPQLEFVEVLT